MSTYLDEVGRAAGLVREAREALADRRAYLHETIAAAVESGERAAEVARVAGVSRARVTQLAPQNPVTETPIHAQKNVAGASCVTPADTVPAIPDTPAGMLSGIASVRKRDRYGRATIFLDTRDTSNLWAILDAARQANAGRVILCGPAPLDTSTGATKPEAVRAWALVPVDGWTAGDHYLADPELPVLRFKDEHGHRVVIVRGAAWWGETDADVRTCQAAWDGLGKAIAAAPAFAGAGLADTPATTGRALWMRTIPEGRSFPVLSDELRELIHATSGQGRVELLPDWHAQVRAVGDMPRDFTVMDGRFMYAALTWGMPVGEPVRWTGEQVRALAPREYERAMRGRGRWLITATVPDDWQHVGMFMAPCTDRRWCYPRQPGETFTTWADGAEVWAALSQGWHVTTHEGITWAEGKPLDRWRDALVSVWKQASASESPAGKLASRAVRMIVLATIGAFATRAHPVTRTAPLDSNPDVPRGTPVTTVGDSLVWEEAGTLSAWSMEAAHPEWSATVWARARSRLLLGNGVGGQVGALTLEPSRVVAFATDALYLAGGAPAWADDGEPGRFRVKGHLPGAFAWPAKMRELHELRDRAEGA